MNIQKIAIASGVAAIASAVALSSAFAASYTFNTNLKLGSRGNDVLELQKVLNADPATQVSASGVGSAGNETTYFGNATRNAVIKFQEKYAADILTPVGLTKGTGNVFASTRAKLNAVSAGTTTGTTTSGTTTTTSGVSVNLGANPASNVIIEKQSGATLANFVLTGNNLITNIELTRTGLSTNNTLTNVYLYEGATRLTDAASVASDGKIRFNNVNLAINGSRTITVRADVADATNGQMVGVNMTAITVAATVSSLNVAGPMLSVAKVDTATFTVTNTPTANATVNAGTNNQTLVDFTANVGTRAVVLKGMTFKYVGSAPINSVSNIGLYIDGVQVGFGTINANNRVVFDFTSSPRTLATGNRVIQLRGDIVGGAYRQFQFSIENAADVMAEDSNLVGVNVTPVVGSSTLTNLLGTNYTVQEGKLTVNLDPSYTDTKVVGGASNAVLGQFKFQAYGEDMKIETLTVSPTWTASSTPTSTDIQNVTLYVNGAAVGSQQNWTGGSATMTFNLGSQFIIPAGQSAILTVKGDLRNSAGVNYTAGKIRTDVAVTLARGSYSQTSTTVSAVVGRNLTVSSAEVTFAKTSGFVAQNVSPNTANVKVGSFTVQASDAEDVVVTNLAATVTVAGSGNVITNYSNLKLADSSVIYGQLLGSGSVHNFSTNVTVAKNTTKTFDVYADLGSVPANGTIKVDGTITYRGVNSAITTTSASAAGVLLTANTATLGTPTLVASSPVTQLVVGGTTAPMATFNVVATSGNATITDLGFTATTTDAITSITVGGVTSQVVTGGTTYVRGLNLNVAQGLGGLDIPVTVTYGTVASNGGINSQASAVTKITLSYIKALSGNTTLESTPSVASNSMQLVASKPTITVPNTVNSGLILGTENKIGEVTIAADASGSIKINEIKFAYGTSGFSTSTITGVRLADGTATVTGTTVSGEDTVTFTDGYTLAAGTSKTFSVYATVNGTVVSGMTASVSTKVDGGANFKWVDVNGSATVLTGANIYNFPTSSYTVKQ